MYGSPSYSGGQPDRITFSAPRLTRVESPSPIDAYAPPLGDPRSAATTSIPLADSPDTSTAAPSHADTRGFVTAPPVPTESGFAGMRFDFNDGCRISLPEGDWTIRLRDAHTDTMLFDTQIGAGVVTSTRKHFVPFSIEIDAGGERVFDHRFDAHDKPVLIQFQPDRPGDVLGWFGYAVKFQRRHHCKLTCSMPEPLLSLLQPGYPDIEFVTPERVRAERYYATYKLGRFIGPEAIAYQPSPPQLVGRHRSAAYMLGVDPQDAPPRIELTDDSRPLARRYVCVAAQSAQRCARWDRPGGWQALQQFLTGSGYEIVCIDSPPTGLADESSALAQHAYCLPPDAGWIERARWLRHADCLIGVPGDFPWLAWAVGTPVVLIGGFTHPISEFSASHRVINFHTCNSCWNDPRAEFDDADPSSCPRHAGTLRQFECTRLISVEQVKHAIRSIPGIAG
ncbi:autotransporter strand-loop-strand O-heptosyltransferase [Burkholderia alba]|uniref:autotransporter strand-loop-strand O-heptosyltransferase n=1 Tax=Burkholderia alba TaxID=2683677 RepID=UPI002B05D42E|nr:autotransporter strand-loop-strand O-heptosyltransferase [Burkholderia alba]